MINEFYADISIVLCSLLIVLGLYILFLVAPQNPALQNYHVARRALACAYLFFGTINLLEYVSHSKDIDISLMQLITLVVGCSQAFLFTYSLITLINMEFATRKRVISESIPILLFSTLAFIIYFTCSGKTCNMYLFILSVFYVYLMIRFTRMFLFQYRQYLLKIDNYYSDSEAQRLRWVYLSFFASLLMGILALVMSLLMWPLGSFLFSVVIIIFYVWFCIRFLSYANLFPDIEVAIKPVSEATEEEEQEEEENATSGNFRHIEENLRIWIAEKRFTESGITLDLLARQFYTNRKYLSSYFNTVEEKTFRDWINDLRIREAQVLLKEHPEMTVNEVALCTGFLNQSNFGRQFLKQIGVSPNVWRKQKE